MLALNVAGLDDLLRLGTFPRVDRASVQFALEEFNKIASNEFASSDRVGNQVGARFDSLPCTVQTPEAFHRPHARYVKSGLGSVAVSAQVLWCRTSSRSRPRELGDVRLDERGALSQSRADPGGHRSPVAVGKR